MSTRRKDVQKQQQQKKINVNSHRDCRSEITSKRANVSLKSRDVQLKRQVQPRLDYNDFNRYCWFIESTMWTPVISGQRISRDVVLKTLEMKTGSHEHKHTDRLWCTEGIRGDDVIHPVVLLPVWSTFYEGLCVREVWVTQSLLPGFIRINTDVMIVLLWLCVTQTWQRSRENCFLWQIIVELQAAICLSRLIFYNLPPPNIFDLSVISSLRFLFLSHADAKKTGWWLNCENILTCVTLKVALHLI